MLLQPTENGGGGGNDRNSSWRGAALELAPPSVDPVLVLDHLEELIIGPNHRAKPIVPTRMANASSNYRGVSAQVCICNE